MTLLFLGDAKKVALSSVNTQRLYRYENCHDQQEGISLQFPTPSFQIDEIFMLLQKTRPAALRTGLQGDEALFPLPPIKQREGMKRRCTSWNGDT